MANLSEGDRKRLAAILGMLGSDAPGERDNAARLAERFRLEHGLTWAELLALKPISDGQGEESVGPAASTQAAWATSRPAQPRHAHKTPWFGVIATAIIVSMLAILWSVYPATSPDHRQQSSAGNSHSSSLPNVNPKRLSDDTAAMSADQRGAVGEHVRECWNKYADALDTDKQHVLLKVVTDSTGRVRKAEISVDDTARMSDPRFRAFVERAVRAIMDTRCANLPLPGEMLGKTNVLTFRFSP